MQRIFAKLTNTSLALAAGLILSLNAFAQNDNQANEELDALVSPDIERRVISEDMLDSEDWEIGVYGGILNVEEFDSNIVYGVRLAYHMTESLILEINLGSSEVGDSFEESLDGGLPGLNSDDRAYTYYNISYAYNIFPGEVFFGGNTAYKTDIYLMGGLGNTTFNQNDFFTYSIGAGLRFYLTDAIALHATLKDHIYDSDVLTEQQVHNIESTLGFSIYF